MRNSVVSVGMVAALMMGALQACSSASSTPLPQLSATDRDQNVSAIMSALRHLCLDHVAQTDAFDAKVAATGWDFRRTQQADESTTLDVWRAEGVELIHSGRPIQAPDADVWTCSLTIAAGFAPAFQTVQEALSGLTGSPPRTSENGAYWEWRPSPLRTATATLSETRNPDGLMIFVEFAEASPVRAVFGK